MFTPDDSTPFITALENLMTTAKSSDYMRDMMINEQLSKLLTMIMSYSWHPENRTSAPKRASVSDVKEYLDSHYAEHVSLDDLSTMSRDLSPLVKKLIFLVHDPSHTVLLVSDGTIKCGQLVRDNAGIYNGKGGGSDTFARAIFQSRDMAETFMDLIEKHLK